MSITHDDHGSGSGPVSGRVRPPGGRGARVLAGAVFLITPLVLGGLVLVFGVLPQKAARARLIEDAASRASAPPRVSVVQARRAAATLRVTLPGRIEAIQEASLFPREGGYIGRINADIGDAVKAGQILAEIESPVLDQEIELNKAAIAVADAKLRAQESQLALADVTLERLKSVGDARAVSQQQVDEAQLKRASTKADVAAAQAELAYAEVDGKRLSERKAFTRIVAPFDGRISARGYDAGALVVADKVDSTKPLFKLTRTDKLRVFVDVPQSSAVGLEVEQPAEVRVKELGARAFKGRVARKSASFDAATRTLLTEVQLDNAEGTLSPGMFAEVTIETSRPNPPVMIPSEALIVRRDGTKVAVVRPDSTIHFIPVTTGRDFGTEIEVLTELKGDEKVALSLSRDLPDGTRVEAVENKK